MLASLLNLDLGCHYLAATKELDRPLRLGSSSLFSSFRHKARTQKNLDGWYELKPHEQALHKVVLLELAIVANERVLVL